MAESFINTNHMLVQSGKVTTDSNGSGNVTFPRHYKQVFGVVASNDAWNPVAAGTAGVNESGFIARSGASKEVFWIAYGIV